MNVNQFFQHWGIVENPFRGEEARHDAVFARIGIGEGSPVGDGVSPPSPQQATSWATHADFEKILGELMRPSTSIVFGEKGSGKTAIRLQIEDRVRRHNASTPDRKTFLIPYDDLNRYIAEVQDRAGSSKDPMAAFRAFRLVDHMDAMLSIAADRVSAAMLGEAPDRPTADLGPDPVRDARRLARPLREDLLALIALYDPADADGSRTARVRKLLRLPPPKGDLLWRILVGAAWLPAAGLLVVLLLLLQRDLSGEWYFDLTWIALIVAVLGYAAVLVKRFVWDRFASARAAKRVQADMPSLGRAAPGLASALAQLDPSHRAVGMLPHESNDAPRYAMFDRLRRVLARFGYTGMLVLIDRVDEPTLINGDADKMRELVWPLFNSKFLQQDGLGVKMLLPLELRHALFKESTAFFQEARLDKQSLIERLTWTGPMLYDLCNARLNACRNPGAGVVEGTGGGPISLKDLFDDTVTRADIVDALEQMHQPRDAFKLLYRCINEHCATVTAEDDAWRIAKPTLEQVRRAEADRVQQLHRGIRPA